MGNLVTLASGKSGKPASKQKCFAYRPDALRVVEPTASKH